MGDKYAVRHPHGAQGPGIHGLLRSALLSSISYLKYQVSQVSQVSRISSIKYSSITYLVSQVSRISSISYLKYLVSQVSRISSISYLVSCILYLVSPNLWPLPAKAILCCSAHVCGSVPPVLQRARLRFSASCVAARTFAW
jgi:hypothetical protein